MRIIRYYRFPLAPLAALLLACAFGLVLISTSRAPAQTPPATGGCLVQNPATGVWTANCAFVLQGYLVAALPTCNAPRLGMQAYVTDALTPTYNGALTGGSSTKVPVFCNGASWTSH